MIGALIHVCLTATALSAQVSGPLCHNNCVGDDATSLLQRGVTVTSSRKHGEDHHVESIHKPANILEISTSTEQSATTLKLMEKLSGYSQIVKEVAFATTSSSFCTLAILMTSIALLIAVFGCFGIDGLGTTGSLAAYLFVSSFKVVVLKALYHLMGNHPCIHLFFISLGMAALSSIVFYRQSYSWKATIGTKWSVSLLLVISSIIVFFENVFLLTSLAMLPSSVVVLLQMGLDIVVLSAAIYFVRGRRHSLERLLGIALIVGGLLLVGSSLLAYAPIQKGVSFMVVFWSAFGYLFARSCINALRQIIDEWLLQENDMSPELLAAVHGAFCLAGTLSVLTVTSFTGNDSFHVIGAYLSKSPLVTCLSIALILLGGADQFLNKLGVKKVGALSRIVVKSLRPAVVWGWSLFSFQVWPSVGGEAFKGVRSWCHLGGLLLQFLGMLFYADLVSPKEDDTSEDIQSKCYSEDTDNGKEYPPGVTHVAAEAGS